MTETVDCEDHGKQKAANVCQHIVMSRDDGQARGFVADRDGGEVSAYCDACDDLISKHDGEWDAETIAATDMQLMCEGCTADVAAKNDVEMP